MGIEWVLRPEEKPVKLVSSEAPTVMALLNSILQATPDYSITVRRGVVNVSDSRYVGDSRNFLNLSIGEFSLTKANVYDAEFELRLKIHMTLHPERYAGGWNGGYGYGVPDEHGLDVQNISFAVKDITVRDILDRIITANGNTLWVVNIVPSRMMKNEPFFAQFDTDQKMDFSWKIIPFNQAAREKTGSISGTVTVQGTAVPRAVFIAVPQTSDNTSRKKFPIRSDDKGNFRVDSIPSGNYEIQLVAARTQFFKQFSTPVAVRDGENTTVDVRLHFIDQCAAKPEPLTDADKNEIVNLMLKEALTADKMFSPEALARFNEILLSNKIVESQSISDVGNLKIRALSHAEIQTHR